MCTFVEGWVEIHTMYGIIGKFVGAGGGGVISLMDLFLQTLVVIEI